MIWFGKSVVRFCKSFIKYNKACWYSDVQLAQDQTKDACSLLGTCTHMVTQGCWTWDLKLGGQ